MSDPRDLTDHFNTQLTPPEESAYTAWAEKAGHARDTYDYDLRGAWKSGAGQAANGHFPDTFKKPNHPTFSTESQYNGDHGMIGGTWVEDKGKQAFVPGPSNLHWRSPSDLQSYFKEREPNVELRLPRK
jgi:hypothetical protein